MRSWLYRWRSLPLREWERPCLARSSNRYRYDVTINNSCRSRLETKGPVSPILIPRSPDVGIFPCPGSESLQLALWLTHPCIEKIELSKCSRTCPCIAVHRVISRRRHDTVINTRFMVTEKTNGPFVVLHEADNIVLSRQVDKVQVV